MPKCLIWSPKVTLSSRTERHTGCEGCRNHTLATPHKRPRVARVKLRDGLNLFAPNRCLGCRQLGEGPLCALCIAEAPWKFPIAEEGSRIGGLSDCLTLLWMEGIAVDWIHRFKYPEPGRLGFDGPAKALAQHLGSLLGQEIDASQHDEVMPIPLSRRRLRTKGFNPAATLAHAIFRNSPATLQTRALQRIRDTPPQAGLGFRARQLNVEGAFYFRPSARRPLPLRVWLVDDVRTTGATLAAAAETLRTAGVQDVIGVGLAQTRWRTTTG